MDSNEKHFLLLSPSDKRHGSTSLAAFSKTPPGSRSHSTVYTAEQISRSSSTVEPNEHAANDDIAQEDCMVEGEGGGSTSILPPKPQQHEEDCASTLEHEQTHETETNMNIEVIVDEVMSEPIKADAENVFEVNFESFGLNWSVLYHRLLWNLTLIFLVRRVSTTQP